MALWSKLKFWSGARPPQPVHLERGSLGEKAAREFLTQGGLKFLTANYASKRGEIDLILRDGDCLVFVEVKTRTAGGRTRPSRAVDDRKRRALIHTAQDYLRMLEDGQIPYRFDVVEVLLVEGAVSEIRHNRNSFNSTMLRRRRS